MQPLSTKYSIKDLERLSGVKAHTIRIWEQRYGLLEPERTDSNIRLYSDHDVKRLLNVSLLLRHGGKISRISKLSPSEITRHIHEITKKTEGSDEYGSVQTENLVIAMLEFDDQRFEQCLNDCNQVLGFEQTMLQVIIPFLQKVGMMWRTGETSVLQEHFISNLIRKKILVAIDSLPVIRNPKAETFLLFLPEGELHEMGLLFSKYILKKRGKRAVYLGQNVPREDIGTYIKEQQPDYLLTFFTAAYSIETINAYIAELGAALDKSTLLVAGMQLSDPEIVMPKGVVYLKSVHDLMHLAEGGEK